MRKKVLYICPCCDFETNRKTNISTHFARKRPCKISPTGIDLTDEIKALVMSSLYSKSVAVIGNNNTVTNTTNNVITNNVTNNINVVISPSCYKHFPRQDLSHLTQDFKRNVVETAFSSGMDAAIRQMFDVTYFNPAEMHNRNIIMDSIETHVLDRSRAWKKVDTEDAVKRMLEEQGDAIRNFPDEDDLCGEIDQECIDFIEREFQSDAHLDPGLVALLKAHGIRETEKMMKASSFFTKLADIREQRKTLHKPVSAA